MTTYFLRRLLLLFPTLLGITLITFLLIRLAPGNAVLLKGGMDERGTRAVSAQAREETIKLYGLDEAPLPAYFHWLGRLVRLDFGRSVVDHRPVAEKIWERLGLTVSLNATALALSFLLAVPLGVLAALHRGDGLDRTISVVVFILYSIPSFAAALLLILLVGGGDYLNLLPIYGIASIDAPEMSPLRWWGDRLLHMILPVLCLTYASLASLSRYSRTCLLEVLGLDFVRTARAKGLGHNRVIFLHALRNALIPLVTLLAMEIPGIIGGTIIIESIFSLPGMGQLAFSAIQERDTATIMGIVTISAVVTLLGYLLSDLLYVFIDPRIRYE